MRHDEIQELEFEDEPAAAVAWEDEDESPDDVELARDDDHHDGSEDEPEVTAEMDEPAPAPDAPENETPDEPHDGDAEHASPPTKRKSKATQRKTMQAEPAQIDRWHEALQSVRQRPDVVGDAEEDELEPAELPVHAPTRWARMSELYLEYKFWMNPRSMTGLDDERIGALAASILRGTKSNETEVFAGIEDPIEVVQIETSTGIINLIVDGQRRYLATKFAKLGDDVLVPVVDLEPEPVKWTAGLAAKYLARALEKVGTREGLSSFELSESAERLRSSTDPDTGKDYTLAAVASTVGRSESWVSKVLAARERSTPALLLSWKKGELTDEQFKDLAVIDKRLQKKATSDVVEARKSGDLTGARTAAKEKKALAVAKDKAKEPAGEAKKAAPKKGDQSSLDLPPPRKAPPFAVVEDMLSTAAAHPPTHDYVKGMMDALKWDRGMLDAANFAKPWQTYIARIAETNGKAAKKAKK
jgi:hypothetical protein